MILHRISPIFFSDLPNIIESVISLKSFLCKLSAQSKLKGQKEDSPRGSFRVEQGMTVPIVLFQQQLQVWCPVPGQKVQVGMQSLGEILHSQSKTSVPAHSSPSRQAGWQFSSQLLNAIPEIPKVLKPKSFWQQNWTGPNHLATNLIWTGVRLFIDSLISL